jgi:Zn-dependent protease with chaperone function
VQNLSLVDTARWEKFIFYTHPPTAERIGNAQNWANQQQTKK